MELLDDLVDGLCWWEWVVQAAMRGKEWSVKVLHRGQAGDGVRHVVDDGFNDRECLKGPFIDDFAREANGT